MRRGYLAATLLAMTGSAANATSPVADYLFQNNLQSAVVGAPDLAAVGAGTAYASENVNGAAQTVLTFTAGSGLLLSSTNSIITDPGVYTIRVLARHNPNGYVKYIDFRNLAVDVGLYDDGGYLDLYPEGEGLDAKIGTDYLDVVLTRDASGIAKGYINGVLQFMDDDSIVTPSTPAAVISNANTLYFFLDDTGSGSGEVSDGAVARITIWNAVLTQQEISALEPDLIFANDFDVGGP